MKTNIVKISEIATSPGKLWNEKKMIKAEIRHRQYLNSSKTVKQLRQEIEKDEAWWQLKYQESLR